MRIDAFQKVSKVYETNKTKSTTKVKNTSFSDQLEISQTGKDYHIAKQAVAQAPDVREDKIADIKKRMEAGTYQVDIKDVADKLVKKYFDDTVM